MTHVRPEAIAHEARRWPRPDWRRFVQPGSELAALYEGYERKYDPNQPRAPAGDSAGGQWTGGDEGNSAHAPASDVDVRTTLEKAKRLAASGRNAFQRCIDLCYPLLERFQSPGSDKNTFDYFKCLNACMGKN